MSCVAIEPDTKNGNHIGALEPEKALAEEPSAQSSVHDHVSAHQGYETVKRLAKWLRQTVKKLVADWATVIFTGIIAVATVWNVCVIGRQLSEMQVEQRPWIGNIKINNIKIKSPENATVSLTNIGKSPVNGFNWRYRIIPSDEWEREFQNPVCKEMKKKPMDEMHLRFNLLPGDIYSYGQGPDIQTTGMTKEKKPLLIIGCVIYRWGKVMHQAGFVSELKITQDGSISAPVVYTINAD